MRDYIKYAAASYQFCESVSGILDEFFEYFEHLPRLGKEQDLVTLLLPQLEQRLDHDHLARSLPVKSVNGRFVNFVNH
jgi:hypothetical protein